MACNLDGTRVRGGDDFDRAKSWRRDRDGRQGQRRQDHPLDLFANQAELISLARREIGWGYLAGIRGVICAAQEMEMKVAYNQFAPVEQWNDVP